jgi:hypothetical protein
MFVDGTQQSHPQLPSESNVVSKEFQVSSVSTTKMVAVTFSESQSVPSTQSRAVMSGNVKKKKSIYISTTTEVRHFQALKQNA